MARMRATAPVVPTNALVASAERYPGKIDRVHRPSRAWQQEAWHFFDICPELRFAASWIANAMSRVALFPAEVNPDGRTIKSDDPKTTAILHDIFGGPDGQSQMMHALGLHLTVAGECYLVGRSVEGVNVWEIIGTSEMIVNGRNWAIRYEDNAIAQITLADTDVVIRIWRPHPYRRLEADSPVRALIGVLREIERFDKHIDAQQTSRLAGSGLLLMPQSAEFPPAQKADGSIETNKASAFSMILHKAMTAPLTDAGNPSSVVPLVAFVPDESVDKAKLLTFWSEYDEKVGAGRTDAIHRFATGMDIPPEVVLGMSSSGRSSGGTGSGASHWMSWQIEESAIKIHIEPLVNVVVSGIVISYLRQAEGVPPNATFGVDTTLLKLRPDRSKESIELNAAGIVKDAAVVRENGLDPDDVMDDDDRKEWLLRKVASGSATPEQVNAALKLLGVDLGVQSDAETTRESRPAPSIRELPVRPGPPGTNALLAVSEALVFRALERAGNRMRATGTKPPCPAAETYLFVQANGSTEKLLEDAWTYVPQLTDGMADPAKVTEVLNSYCTTLLTEQAPHERTRLARFLELVEVPC